MIREKNIIDFNDKYLRYKGDKETLLESIKEADLLPIHGSDIYFSDDVWSFYNKLDGKNEEKLILDFSHINYFYKDIVKGVIFQYLLLHDFSYATVKNKMISLRRIANFLEQEYILSYELIDTNLVKKFDRTVIGSEHNREYVRNIMRDFLMFLQDNYKNLDFSNSIEYIANQHDSNKLKAEKEEGKTEDIPDEFYKQIISCAIKNINNKEADYEEKLRGSIVLLLSQTGMRIGELRKIKAGKCRAIKVFDNDDPVYYLEYHSDKIGKDTKTFLTDKGKLAYDCICSLSEEARKKFNIEYVFINRKQGKLYGINTFRIKIYQFVAYNHENIYCLDRDVRKLKGFRVVEIKDTDKGQLYLTKKIRDSLKENKTIVYPNPHQFRVALCNRLIRKGVNIDWVREHMNHIHEEMTVHYIRKQKRIECEKEYAKSVLKLVVNKDIKLMGKDSDEFMDKIEKFIQKNNFNIKKDIDKIISELAGEIPIRQGSNGYCVKSSFGRKCKYDTGGRDMFSAFGICPNQYFTYKTIDITWGQFNNMKKIVKYNIANRYIVQGEVELKKLQKLVEEVLVPQLQEIEHEIDKKSYEKFREKNEIIEWCILNRKNIMEEAVRWKNTTIEKLSMKN